MAKRMVLKEIIRGDVTVEHLDSRGKKVKVERRKDLILNEDYWKDQKGFGKNERLRTVMDYSVGKRVMEMFSTTSPSSNEKIVYRYVTNTAYKTGKYREYPE